MSTNYISQITASNGTTYDIQEGVTTRIFRATCSTATATAAKVATLDDATGYSLAAGVRVAVTFTYGNSADTPTLNVNSGGAKTIVIPTTTISTNYSSDKSYTSWGQYETIIFTYNGTYWITSGSSYMLYKAASIKTSLSDYTNGTNVSYYIPFTNLSGSNDTLTSAYVSPNFKIVDSQTNHLATLNLGNDLGSDETTYRCGSLRLYSQTGKYIELETKDTLSTNGTIYFPDYISNNATIATTEDIPSITLNGNSTTSPSFYAPTSAGSSGQYLKSNGSGAPTWSSIAATDENVKSTTVTAATTNYIVGSTTSTTTTGGLSKHASGVLYTTVDTATSGYTQLRLGNTTATSSAGGKEGQIRLYGTNATYYLDLKPGAIASSNKTITFPNKTGTVALTDDIPTISYPVTSVNNKTGAVSLTASDVGALPSTTTIPSITLNGSSSTSPSFYAPTGAGTSGQYLKSNGSGAPSWTNFPTIPSITLNGSSTTSPSFYAPTSGGTSGYYLKSMGLSEPAWAAFPTIPSITINGVSATTVSFYAPTSAGTSGYYLKSTGNGAPTWTAFPTIPGESGVLSNTVFAGDPNGLDGATPVFRSLIAADIPELLSSTTIAKWNAILGV